MSRKQNKISKVSKNKDRKDEVLAAQLIRKYIALGEENETLRALLQDSHLHSLQYTSQPKFQHALSDQPDENTIIDGVAHGPGHDTIDKTPTNIPTNNPSYIEPFDPRLIYDDPSQHPDHDVEYTADGTEIGHPEDIPIQRYGGSALDRLNDMPQIPIGENADVAGERWAFVDGLWRDLQKGFIENGRYYLFP